MISETARCSVLDILNENVDVFFSLVNYHFEKLSYVKEEKDTATETEAVKHTDNFWDF